MMTKATANNQLYELAVLYRDDISEAEQTRAANAIKQLITDEGGQIKAEDNWGIRHLSYPIKHRKKAVYIFYNINIAGAAISKLESSLNINAKVLRHLISKVDHRRQARAAVLAERQAQRQPPDEDDNDGQQSQEKS